MKCVVAVALAAANAIFAPVPRAAACSCGGGGEDIHPMDGETGVPVDALVTLVGTDLEDAGVRLRVTGQTVDVTIRIELHAGWALVRPAQPLAASTSYTVEVGRAATPLHVATFVTGTGSAAPLAYAGITAFAPETMTFPVPDANGDTCLSSCVEAPDGHISRIRVAHAPAPPGAAFLALRVVDPATQQLLAEAALIDGSAATAVLAFDYCGAQAPNLQPDASYCAQVVAYDEAGRAAGAETELCTVAATCAPAEDPQTCAPVDACDPILPAAPPDAGLSAPVDRSGGCAVGSDVGGLVVAGGTLLAWAGRRRRPPQGKLGA